MSLLHRTAIESKVADWMEACFGDEIPKDPVERNHRFLEEALELVQACGCSKDDAHKLVDYVYARPVGDKEQETGGVMITLAALANIYDIRLSTAAEKELERCWGNIEKIRAKQAAKPTGSPLPGPTV